MNDNARPRYGWARAQAETMLRLAEEGFTRDAIARTCGGSRGSVYSVFATLRAQGIPVRKVPRTSPGRKATIDNDRICQLSTNGMRPAAIAQLMKISVASVHLALRRRRQPPPAGPGRRPV